MRARRVAGAIGRIIIVYAAVLAIPILGSVFWDEDVPAIGYLGQLPFRETTAAFALTALVILLLGLLLVNMGGTPEEDLREREAFFIVGAGWIICAILGAVPFLVTGATQDVTIALFEAMSAITTTGFSALSLPLEDYPHSVNLWRGTLQFFGGMGIVIVAVAILARLTEGAVKLFGSESLAAVTRLRPKLSETAKTLLAIYLALNLASFLAFLFAMHFTGDQHSWKEASYHALIHAFTGIATGGMSSRTNSIGAFESPAVTAVALATMFLGGISLPLYYQTALGGFRVIWRHAEFRFYLVMILLPSLAVAGFFLYNGFSLGDTITHATFAVVTTLATCGFTLTSADPWPHGARLILVVLMFTGGMVGSTVGAIKLARIQILLKLTYYELQKLLHPRSVSVLKVGGRIFPEETTRRIVVFFFSYVTVFIAGAIALSFTGFSFETSVVAAASSLGGVGYGWGGVANGFVDPVPEAARVIAMVLMWMGRLEIFTALLLLTPATYRD